MLLSIITINRNNATGLDKTMQSVLSQTRKDIEYLVIDGASSDNSVEIIQRLSPEFGERLKWVSEQDKGIYNAMNKGIKMASGEYIQILNSGDCLASVIVVEKMIEELERVKMPSILYGNMVKVFPNGYRMTDKSFEGKPVSFLAMYSGSFNHDPVYVKRKLFDKYGFYDESLKVVSDWKWYTKAIVFGGEIPVYVDLDVTMFDMTGISETNLALRDAEKKQELQKLVPSSILNDYDNWATEIDRVKRLKRHPLAYKFVWFVERCLFKLEKRKAHKNGIQVYQ